MLHEVAHFWAGDVVTLKWWDDAWLNEGVTAYMSIDALSDMQLGDSQAAFIGASVGAVNAYSDHPLALSSPVYYGSLDNHVSGGSHTIALYTYLSVTRVMVRMSAILRAYVRTYVRIWVIGVRYRSACTYNCNSVGNKAHGKTRHIRIPIQS